MTHGDKPTHRLVRIESEDLFAQGLDHRGRRSGGAYDQLHVRTRVLGMREVDQGLNRIDLAQQSKLPDVACDPDDLPIPVVGRDASAQRVLVGPVLACKGPIDDHHAGRVCPVCVIEAPARVQWGAHDLEVVGTDDLDVFDQSLPRRRSPAWDVEIGAGMRTSHRQGRGDRNGLYARQRPDSLRQVREEGVGLACLGTGQLDAGGQHMLGIEAGVHSQQSCKRPDH